MVRPVIHSEKHYIHDALFSLAAGALTSRTLLTAVVVASKDAAAEVVEGSIVKAIHIQYSLVSNTADSECSFNVTVEKRPSAAATMTFTQSQNLGSYPNKNNVFFTSQGIGPEEKTYPRDVIDMWLPIPKGKQRMALGDVIAINFASISSGLQACGISIYKEYQ